MSDDKNEKNESHGVRQDLSRKEQFHTESCHNKPDVSLDMYEAIG